MQVTLLVISLLSLLAVTGCTHASGQLRTKNVSIGINTKSGGVKTASRAPGPRHCPPGHAKKGEC